MTQRHRVLDALRSSPTGVTNGQFIDMRITRFSARLEELRDAGYEISTERMSAGVFRYILVSEPSVPARRGVPPSALAGRERPVAATPGQATQVAYQSSSRPASADTLFDLDESRQDGTRSAITGRRLAA